MRITWNATKAVRDVELSGTVVNGFGQRESCPNDTTGSDNSTQRVIQQHASESTPVKTLMQRQPCQEDSGNLVWTSPTNPADLLPHDLVCGKPEVRLNDVVAVMPNECPARAFTLGVKGTVLQPQVHLGLAAVEASDLMRVGQEFCDQD
ncbi:hypothetical protein ACFVYA_37720 [Amycolatopsis sp. NPDC058278]|uniref:hypothetical protein n=1 Tax=Amycolatopsis sp. NPDC058278 TaxID=3346417 RepID=UPI0036D933D9